MSGWGRNQPTASESSGQGYDFGSTSGAGNSASGGIYHPTGSQGGGNSEVDAANVGRVSMDLFNPSESAEKAAEGIGGMFNGLRQALVGGNEDDEFGKASRDSAALGGIPVVGDVGRGIANVLGGAGEVFGGITGGAGGALERVHFGSEDDKIDAEYNAIPEEFRAEYEAAINAEKGVADTGLFDNDYHFKSVAIREYTKHKALQNPTFNPGAFTAPGSLADAVTNIFSDSLGVVGTSWQRFLAGVKNRAGEVQAIGDIQAAGGMTVDRGLLGTGIGASDKPVELSAVEQLAYVKLQDKTWTPDQATDFLVTNGFTAHDAGLSVVLGLTSPDVVLSFGTAAAAKFGIKGVEAVAAFDKASDALTAATKVTEAAAAARAAAKGAKAIKLAEKELDIARGAERAAQEAVDGLKAFHSAKDIRGANVLARAAEGSEGMQKVLLTFGRTYKGLEGTSLGKAAKITRYLIDPMHGIDLKMPASSRAVDLASDVIPRTIADTGGVHHYKGVLDDLLKLDHTGRLADEFGQDFAAASANFGRATLTDMFMSTQLNAGLGEELVSKGIDELFDIAYKSTKERDLVRQVREGTVRTIVQQTWSAADIKTTANVLAKTYPARTAELWEAFLKGASKEQRSFLKFAGYGRLNKELLNWTADAASKGIKVGANQLDPSRMVLLAKGTFTRIAADDLLAKLAKAKGKKKIALIREYQDRYAQLRYITIDPANAGKSVDNFVEWLSDSLEKLPMQATNEELDALDNIDDIRNVLGDGYSLGFKPADEFLHGLERANGTGLYHRTGQAWVDHVADGAISYRPGRLLDLNIAGFPIPAIPGVRVAAKVIDHMDSATRVFKAQVSGAMVTEVAKQRFIGRAAEDFTPYGVNETLANQWWEAIQRATRQKGPMSLSGPRGMGPDQLYEVLKRGDLIPQPLLNGSRRLQPSDVMKIVLNAYDGDMRYIGLTQKLSGRVKSMLSLDGKINYAGQIAEAVWPTLKFRYNPIFQLQEKIEPWVLNAQRGVSFATGSDLTKADAQLEALLQHMTDNSLVRQADLDQFEYSSRVLYGKTIEATAGTQGTRLNRIKTGFGSRVFGDIQGMKRVNMLRTFQKGLGKEVKAAWEEANPGAWDQMKTDANIKAGRVISDDDFAVSLMAQNQLANDIVVRRMSGVLGKSGLTADWANAVKTGAWHTPANLGELKSLDLEHVAASLQLVRKSGSAQGDPIDNLNDLRQAIALGEVKADDITEALNVMGADPDYIRRVNNALEFHWNGFWKTAEKRFALTAEESKALQDMMAGAARMRDMTPVDFMSQVFSPGIRDGQEGILGALDGHLTILREARAAGRKVKAKDAKLAESRTVLQGTEGAATRDDLVRQLSRAFSAHLDPSAKQALLMEFRPELRKLMREKKVQFDLSELNGMWDDVANDELAARITGYMDGVEPTHPFKVIDDDARGVATVRDGANRYMEARGVKPLATRRNFEPDQLLAEDTARAYSALPATPFERTGRKPNITQVRKASTELKPNPGVDERTYQAYQDFVVDTRAQWDHMTAPKEKGGMGIKVVVAKGDPYPDSAAMRADVARGRIRVFAGDSDHPLMTNEQNVMFRAVHDVMGHAAEGFEFGARGELNAAIKHSQMYSDTGRAAMLTETHGQNSWVNFSDDVIPDAAEQAPLPTTIDEYEAEFPFEVPDSYKPDPDDKDFPAQDDFDIDVMVTDEFGNDLPLPVTIDMRIGEGFESLAPEAQSLMLGELASLQRRFPDFKVFHFDVVEDLHMPYIPGDGGWGLPMGVKGVTWGADDGEAIVLMDAAMFEGDFAANEAAALNKNVSFGAADIKKTADGEFPRESLKGTKWNAGSGAAYTLRHEYGHVLDSKLRPVRSWTGSHAPQRMPENEAYFDFMEEFDASVARKQLSEYAFNETQDSAAELFALTFDPNLDITALEPELAQAVTDYRKLLRDTGHLVEDAPNPNAGRTVREVNGAKPGSVYAEQKAALLPQDILDRFGTQYVGRGKHVESNPDVARTAQYFGKWSESVVRNGLLKGDAAQYRPLLDDIAGLPTEAGVPYNFTEAAALNLATQSMVRKWDDAFRLQYFAQERTMLERSINHPMFGLYPASYMWGKVAPELVRFIANEPFGIKTGGLLYGLMDVQANIALRREYDPEFDYQIEQMGHSQALAFLGFMLPSLPWDIGASAPAWMRGIAQQGLGQEKAIADGKDPEDLSLIDAAGKSVDQAFPYKRNAAWAGDGIGELQQLTGLKQPSEAEALKEQKDKDKFVQAAELEAPLAEVMAELRAALSR